MFASLFITSIIRNTDRRYVVILFSVLLTLSCLLVSFANSFSLLLPRLSGWRWAALGDVGVAHHAAGADARGAQSAVGYFRRGIDSAGDRRAAGQLPWRDYRLA
jgi:predicted MFS family arabinose efflux permease